jgi:hypothetical protein
MIQFNGVSPFATNSAVGLSDIASANQDASTSFQSQLSAALTATLQKFGSDPNKIALSIAPIVTNSPQPHSSAPAATSVTPPPTQPGDGTLASKDPVLSFDDAYWASQPPAVQALRNMDDQSQRSVLAAQLAASGYKIDTSIMVWGWDPAKVTGLRQDMGYKWVPSAFQNPIAEAPGVDDHGSQPYDPANPPSGSITV